MLTCNEERYLVRKVENKYLLLDLKSGEGHLLDEIGSIIFQEITSHDIGKAIDNLMNCFANVSKSELMNDVNGFITELKKKGVLCGDDN